VKIWDPDEKQPYTTIPGRVGYSWSPAGRLLATVKDREGDEQGSVLQIVDVESSTSQMLVFPPSERWTQPWRIAWSPDGSRIACTVHAPDAYECVTKVFDRATMAEIHSLEAPRQNDAQEVRSLAWSPDARYLATAMFDGPDGYTIVWNTSTGTEVTRLKHDSRTDSVAWSPDGTRIVTSSWDQMVKIWEVGTWREMLQLSCHPGARPVTAGGDRKVAWTPDGGKIAAGSVWGWVVMWDATTGREVLSFKAHTAPIRSIAISPNGLRIATASRDRTVKIWDTAGRQLLTLRGHDKGVDSVAWSPSEAWLISSGGDGLRIWDGWSEMDGID
jgi:WD40 repeat protein